jgi:hypothetical protein
MQTPRPVQQAETSGWHAQPVAQRTATDSAIEGRCRHCGKHQSDLIRHLDEERARERRFFLLNDRLELLGASTDAQRREVYTR